MEEESIPLHQTPAATEYTDSTELGVTEYIGFGHLIGPAYFDDSPELRRPSYDSAELEKRKRDDWPISVWFWALWLLAILIICIVVIVAVYETKTHRIRDYYGYHLRR